MFLFMFLATLSAILSSAAVIFSGYYAMSITPPERTMFIVIYSIFVSFFVFCFSGSILLLKNLTVKRTEWLIWVATVLGILASFLLIKSTITHWTGIRGQLADYARQWDQEEKVLMAVSRENEIATIKNIKPVGELDGFVENKGWVTSCVSGYYQIKNIKIEE